MGKEGLRERNKRDKLERIVAAADELFRAQGFEATTGRQICERAGIGTGTLFLYVRDKRELLLLIFEPLAERTFARTAAELGREESLVDGLARLFGAFFALYGRHPVLARLFVQELFFRTDPSDGMVALNARLRARVTAMVAAARERGELRRDVGDDEVAAAMAAHYVYWVQMWLGIGSVDRKTAMAGLRRALELQLGGVAGTTRRKRS